MAKRKRDRRSLFAREDKRDSGTGQEYTFTRRNIVVALGLGGLGLLAAAGGRYMSVSEDPFKSLEEKVEPYSGTGNITLQQARHYDGLRETYFAQWINELGDERLARISYLRDGNAFVREIMRLYDMGIERGFIDGTKREEDKRVNESSAKMILESYPLFVPSPHENMLGKSWKREMFVTPALFSKVVAVYKDGRIAEFNNAESVKDRGNVREIHYITNTEDDLRVMLLHEKAHINQENDGIFVGGDHIFLDYAGQEDFAERAGIIEMHAFLEQAKLFLSGQYDLSRGAELSLRANLDLCRKNIDMAIRSQNRVYRAIANKLLDEKASLGL